MDTQYIFNLYNNDIDKIKPNKFIDLIINKTKNFVFTNNFTNEYKIYSYRKIKKNKNKEKKSKNKNKNTKYFRFH